MSQSEICYTNGKFDEKKFQILKDGKSRLPYDNLTMEYLFSTKKVPEKPAYYSSLKDTNIDDQTYEDIKTFWSQFGCTNLAQYSSYYVS